jgi:myo-inositol-hexaphosphate 3-phosphohydrolase
MLTHIVIWKYRAEVEEELRREHVERLRGLSAIVDGIVGFNVGFDVLKLPRSYDTGLVAVFRDRAALEAYTVHPKHIVIANFGRGISDHVASVDFEAQ